MAKYIEVAIKVALSDLKYMAEKAGYVVSKDFDKTMNKPAMKKKLAAMMLLDWQNLNEDEGGDGYSIFFSKFLKPQDEDEEE